MESLLVTGTVHQHLHRETAREAFKRGYKTTIVADAVSSFMPDLHDAALQNLAMKFGWVSTAQELMTRWHESASAARSRGA